MAIEIEPAHSMQSHTQPTQPGLTPAYLFVEPTAGLEFGDVDYPPFHERDDKKLGKLTEYTGKSEFKIRSQSRMMPTRQGVGSAASFNFRSPPNPAYFIARNTSNLRSLCKWPGAMFPRSATNSTTRPRPRFSIPSIQPIVQTNLPAKSTNLLTRIQDWLLTFGFTGAIVVALIGGFVLNLMPCVLPVISLKILSFVRQSHEERGRIFRLGLTYAAGIMVFFSLIAVLFWQTNKQFGWGQFFQRPHVVLGLAAIVTAFSLSLFGVFAIFTPKVINRLDEKVEGEGYLSAFGTGLLATFLGTAAPPHS